MSRKTPTFSKGVVGGLQWMYLSSMLQGASKLVVLVLLTRLLDPTQFGIMGIALIFTSLAERLGQVGVGPALVQREHLDPEDVRAGGFLSLLSGFLICACLFLAAPHIAVFFSAPQVVAVLQVLALVFVVDGFSIVSDSMLQRNLKFRELVLADNVSYLIGNLIVGVACAWLGLGVWALVLAMLTTRVIRSVLLLRLEPQPAFYLSCDLKRAKSLVTTGVGYSLGKLLNLASLQGDNFVVGRVLGVSFLGTYTRGYQLMTLPAVYLGQVLDRVLFPAMAKKQSDKAVLRTVFFGSVELVTLVSLPASVFMYFLAPEIVNVLFGEKWGDLVPVLKVLSFGIFFRTAYKCGDTLARSMGAPYALALRQAVYTACIVLGSYFGAHYAGLEGVALAVVLAVGVNYYLMADYSRRFLEVGWSRVLRAHASGVWVSLILGIGLELLLKPFRYWSSNSFVVLFAGCLISCVLCIMALAASPRGFVPVSIGVAVKHLPLHRIGKVGECIRWLLGVRGDRVGIGYSDLQKD